MPTTTNESHDVTICGTVVSNPNQTISFPDSNLQTLDRRVGKDNLYFDKSLFAQSLNDWEDVPIIYHPDGIHPDDFAGVKKNPAKTAEAMGGKLVGHVSNPRIVTEGGARLMASLDIDVQGGLQREIMALWKEGKLRPSTAFQTKSDNERILTPPIPNHVLIFPEKLDVVQAGDYGAYVNSIQIEETPMTEPKTETIEETPMVEQMQADGKHKLSFYEWIEQTVNKILDKKNACGDSSKKKYTEEQPAEVEEKEVVESVPVADAEVKPAETAEVVAEVNSESKAEEVKEEVADAPVECAQSETVETKTEETTEEEIKSENSVTEVDAIAELKAEIESIKNSKDAEIETLKSELAHYKEQETEQKFTRLLNSVPVGMKSTDAQVKDLREQFNTNLEGLMFSILEAKNNTASETKAVGSKFMFSESTPANKYTTVGNLSTPNKEE